MRKLNIFEYAIICGIAVALIGKAVTSTDWLSSVFVGIVFSIFVVCAEFVKEEIKRGEVK